jgi:hypothetical protein
MKKIGFLTAFLCAIFVSISAIGAITGPSTVCAGTTYTYNAGLSSNQTVEYWSISGGEFVGSRFNPTVNVIWHNTTGTKSLTLRKTASTRDQIIEDYYVNPSVRHLQCRTTDKRDLQSLTSNFDLIPSQRPIVISTSQ